MPDDRPALDCRSPEGETVGLIDAAIHVLRVASRGDLTRPETVEALLDFAADPEVRLVLDAADVWRYQFRTFHSGPHDVEPDRR